MPIPVGSEEGEGLRIRDTGLLDLLGTVGFTVFLTVLCVAVAFGIGSGSGAVTILCYVVFLGIPIACLAGMVFLIRHRRRFGGASLFLKELPLRVGETVVGEIHTDKTLIPVSDVKVRLKCVRRSSRRWGAIERRIAASESQIGAAALCTSEESTIIPIAATISDRGKASAATWGGGRILWILEAEAISRKPHFQVSFVIPIKAAADA